MGGFMISRVPMVLMLGARRPAPFLFFLPNLLNITEPESEKLFDHG